MIPTWRKQKLSILPSSRLKQHVCVLWVTSASLLTHASFVKCSSPVPIRECATYHHLTLYYKVSSLSLFITLSCEAELGCFFLPFYTMNVWNTSCFRHLDEPSRCALRGKMRSTSTDPFPGSSGHEKLFNAEYARWHCVKAAVLWCSKDFQMSHRVITASERLITDAPFPL